MVKTRHCGGTLTSCEHVQGVKPKVNKIKEHNTSNLLTHTQYTSMQKDKRTGLGLTAAGQEERVLSHHS